jgi:hypothetical protein
MSAGSLIDVVQQAVDLTGMTDVPVEDRTVLLSDNGPGYLSRQFNEYLGLIGIRSPLASIRGSAAFMSVFALRAKLRNWRSLPACAS